MSARGVGCKIVLPDDASQEKEDLLVQFGAHVSRVKNVSIVNKNHYVKRAESLANSLPGGIMKR